MARQLGPNHVLRCRRALILDLIGSKGVLVVYAWDDHEISDTGRGRWVHASRNRMPLCCCYIYANMLCLLSKVPSRQVFSMLRCNQQRDIKKTLMVGRCTGLLYYIVLPEKAYLIHQYLMAANTYREKEINSLETAITSGIWQEMI